MKTLEPVQKTLAGVWHNQHNSQMHIEVDESGKIAGYFVSGVSVAGDESKTYPLTGFAKDDVFAFCVDFAPHGCMTTWVGQVVDPERRHFQAMWQMVAGVHGDKKKEWKSTWLGQDVFYFGPRSSDITARPDQASHPLYCSLI